LEKAYDKVPRNVMWWPLQKHKVSTKYITLIKDMHDKSFNRVHYLIKDMYDNVMTSV
jgi:hypothetical protein